MKKTLLGTLFLLFTFALSLPGFSQVSWGIKGGANVANFKSRDINYLGGNHNRLGYHAGLFAEITLSRKVFFQPSLLYSLKGWHSKPDAGYGAGRVSFDYIDLPLLAGYRLTDKLSLMAGPGLGYLIKARAIQEASVDITGQYKKFDVGISGTASYSFTPRLGMQVSYSYGLRRIHTIGMLEQNGNFRNVTRGTNRVLQVSAYYLIKKRG
ncbi:porin family protein [Rhodocytophaga aerolata]|uniref:Porin family protein n=1 Tax=Rhodocytophaga aerolata TaxID=455078 RepID=A0ABT8R5N1_9BACT|nr:porin family protein [Rhodocytophaga aerolata]MDO1447404.1 porin family protein [Rhodocytophaga aerolata]